ncbi:MAG: sugar O-acetyltransferase [Culicoidibacterales bacterium]
MGKTELQKMIAGEFYQPADAQLSAMRMHARKMTRVYNETEVDDLQGRQTIIKELFGSTTDNFYIEPPFRCDYGSNIHWGDNSYANFNLLILDIAPVTIGKNVMFAPNVTISSATHPIIASERNSGFEYGQPVVIGDNVWVGSGVIINPGVTIGDNAVIGAGSVVVKDIPANVVAVGNPCRVLRPITAADKMM